MIKFIRGDTQPFKFKLTYKDKTIVPMEDIDTIILTCRLSEYISSEILFTKKKSDFTLENEYYHCQFNPEDTQKLEYGEYAFDIEVTLKSGYRKTLYNNFELKKEVTIHNDEV